MKATVKNSVCGNSEEQYKVLGFPFKGKEAVVLSINDTAVEFLINEVQFFQSTDNIDKAFDGDLMSNIELRMLDTGQIESATPMRLAELLGFTKEYCEECLDFHNYQMPRQDWMRLQRLRSNTRTIKLGTT